MPSSNSSKRAKVLQKLSHLLVLMDQNDLSWKVKKWIQMDQLQLYQLKNNQSFSQPYTRLVHPHHHPRMEPKALQLQPSFQRNSRNTLLTQTIRPLPQHLLVVVHGHRPKIRQVGSSKSQHLLLPLHIKNHRNNNLEHKQLKIERMGRNPRISRRSPKLRHETVQLIVFKQKSSRNRNSQPTSLHSDSDDNKRREKRSARYVRLRLIAKMNWYYYFIYFTSLHTLFIKTYSYWDE